MHPKNLVPAFRLRETQAAAEAAVAASRTKGPKRDKRGRFVSAKRKRTRKSKGA